MAAADDTYEIHQAGGWADGWWGRGGTAAPGGIQLKPMYAE